MRGGDHSLMPNERNQSECLSPTAFEPRGEMTVATSRRLTPATVLLVVAGLIIAYVLFFLLTARSVSVTVDQRQHLPSISRDSICPLVSAF